MSFSGGGISATDSPLFWCPSDHANAVASLDSSGGASRVALPKNHDGNPAKSLYVDYVSGTAIKLKFGDSTVVAGSGDFPTGDKDWFFTVPPGATHVATNTGVVNVCAGWE